MPLTGYDDKWKCMFCDGEVTVGTQHVKSHMEAFHKITNGKIVMSSGHFYVDPLRGASRPPKPSHREGLTAYRRVQLVLDSQPTTLFSQKELAVLVDADQATISRIAIQMLEEGYMEEVPLTSSGGINIKTYRKLVAKPNPGDFVEEQQVVVADAEAKD